MALYCTIISLYNNHRTSVAQILCSRNVERLHSTYLSLYKGNKQPEPHLFCGIESMSTSNQFEHDDSTTKCFTFTICCCLLSFTLRNNLGCDTDLLFAANDQEEGGLTVSIHTRTTFRSSAINVNHIPVVSLV